ncbi:hypothetical protein KUV89_03120 [Marinobacter hydrocarbonoclasticus]|nr:hypothetical protein [Marinobacter nauticus]
MKAATTERLRRTVNALAFAGALLPQAGITDELMNYCLEQIDTIGAPQQDPLTRHRQFGQLILLQDQLKYLAQSGNSDDLGRCSLMLNAALGHYRPQPPPNPARLALEAQLSHLDKGALKTLTIGNQRCWQGVETDPDKSLDLATGPVSRYLNQASDPLCRERVWTAFQNRAEPDGARPARLYRELAEQAATARGYASDAHLQLSQTPLKTPQQVQRFLESLVPQDNTLPWQPAARHPALSTSPERLARDSLAEVATRLGLTLFAINDEHWQLWDGDRLLGYLHLSPSEQSRHLVLQSNWTGLSPAVVEMQYRQASWYPRHWHQWIARTADTMVNIAGQPLPYQTTGDNGAGYGFGRALSRDPAVQKALLGHTLPSRPMFDAQSLYEARMGLAVASQVPWSPTALKTISDNLFAHYFQRPAPKGLTPWASHSSWLMAGARTYLPFWYAVQGRTLLEQSQSGQLSPEEVWLQLAFPGQPPPNQTQKSPAEFAGPSD